MIARMLARGAIGGATALAAVNSTTARCETTSAQSSLFDLTGKVALVTGASRGIGFAIARGLAEQGATVVMSGTSQDRLVEARWALLAETNAPPTNVFCVAFDVCDEAACIAAVKTVREQTGRTPDILVNNAGVNHRASLPSFTTERFDHIVRANLVGPFVLARECAPGELPSPLL